MVDPSGQFAPEPRLQAWRFGDLAAPGSGGESHVLADADGVLRSRVIPMGWVPRGEWVRLVDLTTDELLPLPWELEPRLREEIDARQEAQEQARQAAEQARRAEERARRADEQARRADERAATDAAARQQVEAQLHALEVELARLRRQLEGRA